MNNFNLGKIPNPWEYSSDVSRLTFTDSREAHDAFASKCQAEGMVILAFFKTNHPKVEDVLCWVYLFEKDNAFITALAPVFKDDNEFMTYINPTDPEVTDNFMLACDDGIYEPVIMTNNEVAIRKINCVSSEEKLKDIMKARGIEITEAYPVKIVSPKANGTLCVCWLVQSKDYPDEPGLFSVSYEDANILNDLDTDDLDDLPIKLNESVTIGGTKFILKQDKVRGKYFEPLEFETEPKEVPKKPNIIHLTTKRNKYLS